MVYLNSKEEKTIAPFMSIEEKFRGKVLRLIWHNGTDAIAKYDSFIEDENECDYDSEEYEEYWSFVFLEVVPSAAPIKLSNDGFFVINYHNFPEMILCDKEVVYKKF